MDKDREREFQSSKSPSENKRNQVNQPHDQFFKDAFSNKEAIQDFLVVCLPKDLLSKIDQENIRLTNKSFVNVGRRGESDLVFQTQINGQAGYLYFIIEHQSESDHLMPLRFLEYNVQLMRQHLKEQGNVALPIIVNICIYNGNKAYKGATSLATMFADPSLAKKYLLKGFHLVDLYSTSESQLMIYKKAAFAAMVLKQGIYRNFTQWFKKHINLIVDLLAKDYIPYVDAVFWYMLSVDNSQELLKVIKQSNPKLESIVMSIAERLRQEGRQEGRQIVALAMLEKGYPIADIVVLTGLSPAQIELCKKR